jgi:Type VI secretion system (T6SS), amidase effector protein 4
MAHFVDGRKFVRISGQLIHVPMGTPTKVGLWGGMESSGRALDVAPDDSTIVKVARSTKRGDISMFVLTAVKAGETILNATAANSSVWDTCQVHVHMPRRRQLPAWDKLYNGYAGDDETSEDFRARIGGEVDNDNFDNTCILRMSEAFNLAGQPIPRNYPGLRTYKGADKLNYAIRVAEFKKYMLSAYGTPDLARTPPKGAKAGVARADFANLRGVLCFEVHFVDATGHFTLWDGSQAVHGDYFSRAFRVSLWMSE